MHFSGAAEWRELTKQWFLSYLFCIIPLHVSLEQIYLERQLTLKEILPLEEVCLYFVYPLHESSIVVLFTKGRALFEQGWYDMIYHFLLLLLLFLDDVKFWGVTKSAMASSERVVLLLTNGVSSSASNSRLASSVSSGVTTTTLKSQEVTYCLLQRW